MGRALPSSLHTCHSRTHPAFRVRRIRQEPSLSPAAFFFSIPFSLLGKRLSKNCSALARNPLTIPLLNLRPHYTGEDVPASPALKFTSRRNRRNDEMRSLLVDTPERITHNDFIRVAQLSAATSFDNAHFD